MMTCKSIFLLAFFLTSSYGWASFYEDVLYYDDKKSAKGMHLRISGVDSENREWKTREIVEDDFHFLRSLYSNQDIMKLVGDGSTRNDEYIRQCMQKWKKNYEDGLPLAAWVLEYTDTNTPIGIFIADTVHDPGVLEVGRIIHTDHQNKKIGTSLMHAVVKIWAPLIRSLGIKSKDTEQEEFFRCFKGSELEKLYITCSPTNIRSWASQISAGFVPLKVANQLTLREPIRNPFSLAQWEEVVDKAFKTMPQENYISGQLFGVTDPQGKLRTVSLHPQYKRVKYHFEKVIN